MTTQIDVPERLSIELTNRCSKACSFCYNHSEPDREAGWEPVELLKFGKKFKRLCSESNEL